MVICVLVIDQFHFVDEITTIISGWMTNGNIKKPIQIKPFSCSLCMSWWINLIYIICMGMFSIPMVVYILFLSWMTPVVNDIFTLIKEIMMKILNKML